MGETPEQVKKISSLSCSVPPSPELVERVRDLYHKRVPDVRFLIPVINGLEKVKLHGRHRAAPSRDFTQSVQLSLFFFPQTERSHPGFAQAHQTQPHRSEGGFQPTVRDSTQ